MRVLIADDHDLVRDTIALYLRAEGDIEVITVDSLDEALKAASDTGAFDVVLLDYDMPGMDGLNGIARMKRANSDKPVAILSGTASGAVAAEAIQAGAAGFVPKTIATNSLLSAVKFMAAGETYVPYQFMQEEGKKKAVADLTERETEVLRGLCQGKSNKEIARDLDLQEVTIKLRVKTLSRKLGAKNRTQAAMIAKERNLL